MDSLLQVTWRLRASELILNNLVERRYPLTRVLTRLQAPFTEVAVIDREVELCEREIAWIRANLQAYAPGIPASALVESAALLERVGAVMLSFDSLADRAAARLAA